MQANEIQAIGFFLAYYKADLFYIKQFQDFKSGRILEKEYTTKDTGSFYSFLVEFKVIRSIPKDTVEKLLIETGKWIKTEKSNDVDSFAHHLYQKGLTHNKIMTSMASKILFLNNPWEIIPIDRLVRGTLKQKENNYGLYLKEIDQFKTNNKDTIQMLLDETKKFATIIHDDFGLINLEAIYKNRILDKFLWATGKNQLNKK